MEAIGVEELKPEPIKEQIQKNPRKAKIIVKYVQRANELAMTEKTSLSEAKGLVEKLKKGAAEARVDITNTVFHKVKIRIGEAETVFREDLKAIRFHLDRENDKKVAWTPLTEADKECSEEEE